MGQKIHPLGMRVGIIRDWDSKWSQKKISQNSYMKNLKIRDYIRKQLNEASVSTIEIERAANRV